MKRRSIIRTSVLLTFVLTTTTILPATFAKSGSSVKHERWQSTRAPYGQLIDDYGSPCGPYGLGGYQVIARNSSWNEKIRLIILKIHNGIATEVYQITLRPYEQQVMGCTVDAGGRYYTYTIAREDIVP